MFKSLSLLLTAALGMCAQIAQCQTLSESILARWQTYIFVSTEMPRSQLETLARDSLNTRTTLVFNGFGRGGQAAIQNYVFQVNQSCCLGKASFAIDPVLTSKYNGLNWSEYKDQNNHSTAIWAKLTTSWSVRQESFLFQFSSARGFLVSHRNN